MATPISADARAAKLQTSFKSLAAAAGSLNTASDQFSDAVTALDAALNSLSPGVTAWVVLSSVPDEDYPWQVSEERLGFAKTNGRWGLSLCRVEKDTDEGEEKIEDIWLFNDAPRSLRLEAIEHVPELVEALAEEAMRTAGMVANGAGLALQLAASINTGKQR